MNSRSWFEVNMLIEQAKSNATCLYNFASIRRLFAANKSEDRALASTVSTYKSYVLARVDLKRRTA
jgi:hypothetical protein